MIAQCYRSGKYLSAEYERAMSGFTEYIIAKCFPKIDRRINHPVYSLPFFDALMSIVAVPFILTQTDIDQSDADFLFMLPHIASEFNIEVPHLMQIAQSHINSDRSLPLPFYNAETSTEYHQVLCAVLKGFSQSLATLTDYMRTKLYRETLDTHVHDVKIYGLSLLTIARGKVIETHLRGSLLYKTNRLSKREWGIMRRKERKRTSLQSLFKEVQPGATIGDNKPFCVAVVLSVASPNGFSF